MHSMTPLPPVPPTPPLWVSLAVVAVAVAVATGARGHGGSGTGCGGMLSEPRGVLATPNFPGPPPVPLHCHWVINASSVKDGNITIYLTQQYVLRGLVFYVHNYAFDGNIVEEVLYRSEDSSVMEPTYYVRSDRQAVFINVSLPRLEGNHLRVLQGLRDVYGFNITYEVTFDGEPGRQSCTPMSCSGVGHCLANHDYTNFSCNCPENYFGVNCSSGPLCSNNPCRNGGGCSVAGTDSIVCDCRGTNFSGMYCEYSPVSEDVGECEPGSDDVCNCISGPHIKPVQRQYTATLSTTNAVKYNSGYLTKSSCSKSIEELFSLNDTVSLNSLKRNVTWVLNKAVRNSMARKNITDIYDLHIIEIMPDGNLTFGFSSVEKNDAEVKGALDALINSSSGQDALESVQSSMCSNSPFTRISVNSAQHFYLEKVASNAYEGQPLKNGSQVVFSCFAVGSSHVSFSWYKDGHLVTPGKNDKIWTETTREKNNRITSLLCVEHVTPLDSGRWTCRVRDELGATRPGQESYFVEQCRSVYFYVQQEPIVRLRPPSASTPKGGAVCLSCLEVNDGGDSVRYSWSRNGIPLQSEGDHVWEPLEYPRGCLLRLQNVSESATYTCHVKSNHGIGSVSAPVEVLSEDAAWCDADADWPPMPIGATALVECPQGSEGWERGLAQRKCASRTNGRGEYASWSMADFSQCLLEAALPLDRDLKEIALGYSPSTPRQILRDLHELLQHRSSLRPHQGEAILALAMSAWRRAEDRYETHQQVVEIVDLLLSFPTALASPKVLKDMLKVTEKAGFAKIQSHSVETAGIVYRNLAISGMMGNASEYVGQSPDSRLRWLASLYVRNTDKASKSPLVLVQFRSLEGIITYGNRMNGSNGIYRVLSTVVKISSPNAAHPERNTTNKFGVPLSRSLEIEATFSDLALNLSTLVDDAQLEYQYWNLTCAYARNLSAAGPWDLTSCATLVAKDEEESSRTWIPWRRAVAFVSSQTKVSVQCVCKTPGAYAVLLTKFSQKPDAGVPSVVVILALWCCALEAAAALVLPFVVAPSPTTTSAPSATSTAAPVRASETPAEAPSQAPPSGETPVVTPRASDVGSSTAKAFRMTSCINTALVAVIMASTMCKWDTVLPAVLLQCLLLLGITLPTAQLYLVAVELGTFPVLSISSLWSRQCSRSQATAFAIAIVPVAVVLVLWLSNRDVRATLSQCWSSWLDWSDPACWAVVIPSTLVAVAGVWIAGATRRLSSVGASHTKLTRFGSAVRLCAVLVCQLVFLVAAVLYTSVPGLPSQVALIFASLLSGYSLLLCYVVETQWLLLWSHRQDSSKEEEDEAPPARCSTSTTDCECESRWLPKILCRAKPSGGRTGRPSAPNPAPNPAATARLPASPASAVASLAVDSPDSLKPLIASARSTRRYPLDYAAAYTKTEVPATTTGCGSLRAASQPRQLVFPSDSSQSTSTTPSEDNAESSLLPLRSLDATCSRKVNGHLHNERGSGTKVQCTADIHGNFSGRMPKRTERRNSTPQMAPQGTSPCLPRRSSQMTQFEFRRMFFKLDDIEEVGSAS